MVTSDAVESPSSYLLLSVGLTSLLAEMALVNTAEVGELADLGELGEQVSRSESTGTCRLL